MLKRFITGIIGLIILLILVLSVYISPFKVIKEGKKMTFPYYFLVMGMDSSSTEDISRTDSIILGGINEEGKIVMLPIPRDLLIEYDGRERRINSIYEYYGVEALLKEVSDIFGVKVEKYMVFNYEIFKQIGDIIAPVKVYVDTEIAYTDYHQNLFINFQKGINEMDGQKLLEYMRFRYDIYGDIGRIERQKNALYAILSESMKKGVTTLLKIFRTVLNDTLNNFNFSEIMGIYQKVKKADITFLQFPSSLEENYVLIDSGKIEDTKYNIINFKAPEKEYRPWIIFTRNYTNKMYNFYTYISSKWNVSGNVFKIVDREIEDSDNFKFDENKSYIFFKNTKNYDYWAEKIKSVFGTETVILNDKDLYFYTINFLSANLIDTENYDILVILGE